LAVKRVKTAIIGVGYWGPNLLRNFSSQPACDLAVACDLAEGNLEKVRRHYPSVRTTSDVQEIWNDASIELVLIATPTATHAPLATAALESGKHVFVEKPLAATSAEGEALAALATKRKRLLFVDHTFLFAPAVRKIADLAAKESLGKLLYFDSVRINLGLIQKDVNVLWDLAIHDLSILSAFTDLGDVATVCAHGQAVFGQQVENAHMHLTYASGFGAHIHASWLSPAKIRQTIVAGSKAMVLYDDTEPSEKIRLYDKGVERDATKPDPFFPKYRSGDIVIPALPNAETLGLEAAHVLRCVLEGEAPLAPGEDGVKMLRILEAANASLLGNGAPVSLR